MPFSHQEPATRMERMRSAVRDGAAGAAHTVSGAATSAAASAAGAAQGAGRTAAGAGRDAAVVVADRAAVAAQQVADRATVAAATMTDRARPIAAEASARGAAAWRVLRYGAPRPTPLGRVVSVRPMTAVTTAARRSRTPMGLMLLGAAGAVVVLWLRRSRTGDSMWILDDDSDIEPVGRWHEGDSRVGAADDKIGKSAEPRDSGADAGPTTTAADRKDSPANRWP